MPVGLGGWQGRALGRCLEPLVPFCGLVGVGMGETTAAQKVLMPFNSKHMYKVSFTMYVVCKNFIFICYF